MSNFLKFCVPSRSHGDERHVLLPSPESIEQFKEGLKVAISTDERFQGIDCLPSLRQNYF